MGLPGVNIEIQNGALGLTASTEDGIAALILSGVAVAGKINLLEPKQIFSTDEAKALGLDAAYDVDNGTEVWKNISDFYAQAGEGSALWIMLYVNTTLMSDVVDQANAMATKVLDAAGGKIRIMAIGRIADGGYVPTYNDGMDDDVAVAVTNAHALANAYAAQFKPLRVLVDGRDYQGVVANLVDLKGNTNNRVGVVLGTDVAGSKSAAIGLALGRLAAVPVQRNIGRVKDGDLGIADSYLTDGATTIESVTSGEQGQIHDKGYIFMRNWQGKNGYFFNDDPTAAAAVDDYSSIARGRVIDKAMVITYATYVEEILDDIEIDEDGYMDPAVAKSYQALIDNALNQGMNSDTTSADQNVSSVRSIVNAKQNVQSTEKVSVELKIRPKGYSKTIDVKLGFDA